jgi:hypothetical protein
MDVLWLWLLKLRLLYYGAHVGDVLKAVWEMILRVLIDSKQQVNEFGKSENTASQLK